ncbi:MAG: DinB family protein, partial [Chitinophagaceae bacterium]
PGIPALLQPAAHAIVQAMEEIRKYTSALNDSLIWERPAGVASVGFHLQHITGVLDRLFTYAAGGELSPAQLAYLSNEGRANDSITLASLLEKLEMQVNVSLEKLAATDPARLTETRFVGRKKIPSTMIGLLFHAAEHMQRHTGQILATSAFVRPR